MLLTQKLPKMNNIKKDINSTETYKTLFSKLENPDITYQNFVKRLARFHFQIRAIMQDILECRESMEALNALNEKGRTRINQLRDELELLELYSKDCGDPKYVVELESQRHQLAGLLKEFKEANISSIFAIEKAQREELMKPAETEEAGVRNRRKKVDRDGLLKMSSGVTEQLLSISRHLADTTQRSQDTLDSLVSSSSSVHGTKAELQNTASTITQSSKLLTKYGRREFTDKVIMFFAFLFFLAVCLYIVQKRIF
ncbi:vesicle transport protein SEC20 [Amyelois transitella]|uniref:vesicle transport protein SEC20 n=1 Tax=Amyelois transitella TaxID=680683 RepID=UPI00067CE441|nr:vesicle transport protein SEC20 [Amyelois transitella]